jgi:hypothetical protein
MRPGGGPNNQLEHHRKPIGDNAMNTAALVQSRSNQKMEHNTRGFLKGLNSGERTLPERLSPKSARDLLVEARRMRWILPVLLTSENDSDEILTQL